MNSLISSYVKFSRFIDRLIDKLGSNKLSYILLSQMIACLYLVILDFIMR